MAGAARRRCLIWGAAATGATLTALLGGCAGGGPKSGGGATPAIPPPKPGSLPEPAPDQPGLDGLRSRLAREFAGTPLQLEMGETAAADFLRISVPQPHGFEPGRAAVRPALAAVLDRLVEPLRREGNWTVRVAGPIDAGGSGWIGPDRAAAVRDYLVLKGVAVKRFTAPQRHAMGLTEITLVELRRRAAR
ncbi:hypothetical protein CATMQ487_47780 [Sphaerotilus microaerophilus]|uniref:OmpA-like domain-containing protein n=2 Tax=Sphaerotilus microaerophilus TaxID=2914710 RepID=A0ABM7YT25_9BURK|nr:hypothetical protein CATMQ487_47780 [Sphaerotilus sp. FB-5]